MERRQAGEDKIRFIGLKNSAFAYCRLKIRYGSTIVLDNSNYWHKHTDTQSCVSWVRKDKKWLDGELCNLQCSSGGGGPRVFLNGRKWKWICSKRRRRTRVWTSSTGSGCATCQRSDWQLVIINMMQPSILVVSSDNYHWYSCDDTGDAITA